MTDSTNDARLPDDSHEATVVAWAGSSNQGKRCASWQPGSISLNMLKVVSIGPGTLSLRPNIRIWFCVSLSKQTDSTWSKRIQARRDAGNFFGVIVSLWLLQPSSHKAGHPQSIWQTNWSLTVLLVRMHTKRKYLARALQTSACSFLRNCAPA